MEKALKGCTLDKKALIEDPYKYDRTFYISGYIQMSQCTETFERIIKAITKEDAIAKLRYKERGFRIYIEQMYETTEDAMI